MARISAGWGMVVLLLPLATAQAAAPASGGPAGVQHAIQQVRAEWASPEAQQQLVSSGWTAYLDRLEADLRAYTEGPGDNERLTALGRLVQTSNELRVSSWPSAQTISQPLDAWLRPRVATAWALRNVEDAVLTLPEGDANRQQWLEFLKQNVSSNYSRYEAGTVADRLEGLEGLREAVERLQANPASLAWGPASQLYAGLAGIAAVPNVEATIDFATLYSVLARQIVVPETIYREGQYSYVTPGPYEGFSLLPSDNGIAFSNRQVAYSYTPIQGFQQQVAAADPRGARLTKMYSLAASTQTVNQNTATTVISPSGVQLYTDTQPNVSFGVSVNPTQGGGFQRLIAGLIGFTRERIAQEVYQGAIGRVQAQAVRGAKELSAERSASAEAGLNAQAAQYLTGNNTAVYGNFALTSLAMQSRPEFARILANLQYRDGKFGQYADAPQPPALVAIPPGIAADVHLPSLLTNLVSGYLANPANAGVQNVMIELLDVPPGTPVEQAVRLTQNVDWETYSKAVDRARESHKPQVQAIRVQRPARKPLFGVDAQGNLVAVVRDVTIDIAAPDPATVKVPGPPARVYRVTSPRLELVFQGKFQPATAENPSTHYNQKIVDLDPGVGAQITAIDQDENAGTNLNAIMNALALTAIRTRVKDRPIDVSLDRFRMPGIFITGITDMDPSGWVRVSMVRTP